MNKVAKKLRTCITLLVMALTLVSCATSSPLSDQLTPEHIAYAREHGYAVVEAQVGGGKRHAVGTRSEGYAYPIRVTNLLLPATSNIPLWTTYDYRKTPYLRAGRYLLILQPGPYYRAERISAGSTRMKEVVQWIHQQ